MSQRPRPFRRSSLSAVGVTAALILSLTTLVGPASADRPVGPLPSPEAFVSQQYRDFLGREPDPQGLAYWSGLIEQGTPPGQLVDWMTRSDEFGSVVAPLVRLYLAFFARVPDYEGLRYWAGRLRSGYSLEQIAQQFTLSSEFQRAYGQLDDDSYVQLVYRNVMGRDGDPAGVAYWRQQLGEGLSEGALMVGFSDSAEYRAKVASRVQATMLYIGVLNRRPDDAGLSYWSSVLDGDHSYGDAIAGFLNSGEYQARIAGVYRYREPLTGIASRTSNSLPALAVKIDNVNAARPQTSVDRADIVYEELVEGNLTRLMAVFHSDIPTVVGPVRSIRTTDIDLLKQLNQPLLAASGANPGVLGAIANTNIVDVSALQAGNGYYRSSSRSAPHNLFATTDDLYEAANGAGGSPTTLFNYRDPGEPATEGDSGLKVQIDFGSTEVEFRWSDLLDGWARSQNSSPHVVSDGTPLAPDNVVVLEVVYLPSSVDSQSPEGQTIGTGQAWVLTAGRTIVGTWQRDEATAAFTLRDGNGNPIELTRGQTFVELAPPGSTQLSAAG